MTKAASSHPRAVRSFVRREGRLTTSQRNALAELSTRYCLSMGVDRGLDLDAHDVDTVFGRSAPLHLEIGCGSGETLLELAKQHPENNYIGVEVYRPGIGKILQRLDAETINNVRLICADVVEVLHTLITAASLDCAYILFPDPWPKKRHHKRRLLQHDFLSLLASRMKAHARLFVATDWDDYAAQIFAAIEDEKTFVNLAGVNRPAPRPTWYPQTRFEARAAANANQVTEFILAPRQPKSG